MRALKIVWILFSSYFTGKDKFAVNHFGIGPKGRVELVILCSNARGKRIGHGAWWRTSSRIRSKRGDRGDRSVRECHSDCGRIYAESGEIDKSGIITTPSTGNGTVRPRVRYVEGLGPGRVLKNKTILLQIGLSNDGVREPGTDVAEA
ncbi:hypothetical protein SARC_01312 [Sphaeroforma arctica JP610]|uniref:Uncharacterized protein n=1 Tax=Sphaeroforma arctica JP610 TaxID=667725 RepID=A0A0L0GCA3_9EUKA|nr:hypothetical protein SARC_01312 [Sphaeroforma arctica JP610]KNC86539.1 hypothetical protein SARC_01312 [Sphaeroforma arctica JP610]|eukprot:XP_014160441.1 hypothetical protein SARC_01312 [Sphaeroforma arctica JP610]